MKYTIGKSEGLQISSIGFLYYDDGKISFETDDDFLKSFMAKRLEKGIKKTYCIHDANGGFGLKEELVEPSDAEYIAYVSENMPIGYCIMEIVLSKNQQLKTA